MLRALVRLVTEAESRYEKVKRATVMIVFLGLALYGVVAGVQKLVAIAEPQSQSATISTQVNVMQQLDGALVGYRLLMADDVQYAHAKLAPNGWKQAEPYVGFTSYWENQQNCYFQTISYNRLASTMPASALRAAGLPPWQNPNWCPLTSG